ncbi:sperm acrosome membrane-associated protein 4 [Tachyglossus aculeatus]|uniref:sperm acrosome membrane-associated protein 4 n=1 Tax=Tachyglossus aculeatus TaxID=9261 RepID=UPI0018F5D8DF|nr:sperm acrosome membrane-associated protein 4 [Tachyglossus aculeatus]
MAPRPLLLFLLALLAGPTSEKGCLFCELTDAQQCPGTLMQCAEDEDCFTGHGVALGVSLISNKGCVRATNCGKEQPVIYMGVTYSLVTACCQGELCNAAVPRPGPGGLGAALLLGLIGLLHPWLL